MLKIVSSLSGVETHWKSSTWRRRSLAILALISLFFFRLVFGLCQDLSNPAGDEKQIYLIGLKYFTTGQWPYFGPDVTNTIQIPGALQGLVVGLPFHLLPVPEAPYILLNVLSFSSLCFFAWYCAKRLPEIPKWFIWAWLLTAPWTLSLSTHVYNPSYVLPGAVLFFVSALETYPALRRDLISLRWANFMMGLALFWVMQFHLSWVILVPFSLFSFYFQLKDAGLQAIRSMVWFAGGALLTGVFLVPTYIKYGFTSGLGNTNNAVTFNAANLLKGANIVEGVLGRFLSFASFELPRFIGADTVKRLSFIEANRWLIPFIVFLTLVGILQPIAMLFIWFRKKHSQKDWKAMKYLTLGTVLLLYVSFLFSVKEPLSHTFYVTMPVAMLYSLYCWSEFLKKGSWRKFAAGFLIAGVIFHAGLAVNNYKRISLYTQREAIVEAIKARDYHLLGERRIGARY